MPCGRCRRSAFRTTRSPRCGARTSRAGRRASDVDLDEAAALHRALPTHKQLAWVLRRAVEERRCLTQPRGGFGTFALQLEADGDARQGRPRRRRADDDRQLHAQRALRARAARRRGIGARGPVDAERLSAGELRGGGQPAPDRGHRQAGDHAHRHRDAQAHRRDRIRLRLFRLPRLGHRVHDRRTSRK